MVKEFSEIGMEELEKKIRASRREISSIEKKMRKDDNSYKRSINRNKNLWRVEDYHPQEYHYTTKRGSDGSVTVSKLNEDNNVVRTETFNLDDLLKLANIATRKIEAEEKKDADREAKAKARSKSDEKLGRAVKDGANILVTLAPVIVVVTKLLYKKK